MKDKQLDKANFLRLTIQESSIKTFIEAIAPYCEITDKDFTNHLESDNDDSLTLQRMSFYKLVGFTSEVGANLSELLCEKMQKLFYALHGLNSPIVYGIISQNKTTSFVLGIDTSTDKNTAEPIKNLLREFELTDYKFKFPDGKANKNADECAQRAKGGVISAVPILKLGNEKQKFDISNLVNALNGHNYMVLLTAKPYNEITLKSKLNAIYKLSDECAACGKQTISLSNQDSVTHSESHGKSSSKSDNSSLDLFFLSFSSTNSQSLSEAISSSLTESKSSGISVEKQNSLVLELKEYCDKAIMRLRPACQTGLWGASIAYCAENSTDADIIRDCLASELAKPSFDIMPLRKFSCSLNANMPRLPKINEPNNPLLAPITSDELGMLCTLPYKPVGGFIHKHDKNYPQISFSDGIEIAKIFNGNRKLENMPFSLSEQDLVKHTLVCGITGSGKTTTVKTILMGCSKPFMVIESAKTEYRNLACSKKITVYTQGNIALNCLRLNPFYLQCGTRVDTHIDFLKDLFSASFSFYGPMSNIFEKSLYNIYKKKGWNLLTGLHPYLSSSKDPQSLYSLNAHKYLFPTMLDLKQEVERHINTLDYSEELKGNIKAAILVRLESLCVGRKGFMFNTNEPIDMQALMQGNVVFELEGLSDDADKAFMVGLLIILINEYRHNTASNQGLQHLLVVEEAHRLLKNVETERLTEGLENPKGKAVEHFTNMLAEMRSYGQGVIVAEQIPTKLALDVIKNSSNKIVQRLVAADDQALIANTIGLREKDYIYLGSLKNGVALCHKEGMSEPVRVFINKLNDSMVSEEGLFADYRDKAQNEIDYCKLKECTADILPLLSFRLLNDLMSKESNEICKSIEFCIEKIERALKCHNAELQRNEKELFARLLCNGIAEYLINGVYAFTKNPINSKRDAALLNSVCESIKKCIKNQESEDFIKLKKLLNNAYAQSPKEMCKEIVIELIKSCSCIADLSEVKSRIEQYFNINSCNFIDEIEKEIRQYLNNYSSRFLIETKGAAKRDNKYA